MQVEPEVMSLPYPSGTQNVDSNSGDGGREHQNVEGRLFSGEGENGEWCINGNDSESDDSLIDAETVTDDEEYTSHRFMAEKVRKKYGKPIRVSDDIYGNEDDNRDGDNAEETSVRDNGESNDVYGNPIGENQNLTEFEFDIGNDFKQWVSDDGENSAEEVDPQDSSDEENWVKGPREKAKEEVKFNPNVNIKEFDFCVDMIFDDPLQLKDQIRAYAAINGYSILFKKNDKKRIQAKCTTGCPWALWASFEGKDATFKIKSYQKKHRCPMNLKINAVNATWLAKRLGDRIRLTPYMKLIDIKTMVKKEVGQDVTIKMCRETKKRALAAVKESMIEHYSKIWNYVYEIARTSPESTIVLKSTDDDWVGPPQFRKFYICFDAVKKGFVEGCRKFNGVDGCFLKTWIKGELLAAIGRDANNQMYPIAWAVVEKEDQHTWRWFLNLLARDIGIEDGTGWTIMSDQQKGLELVVKELFPEIEHRNCARHIYANFKKRGYTGVMYRKYFWAAAKSTTKDEFQKNIDKIKALSQEGYQNLMDRDPSRWCKAFFPSHSTCDSVDNNICESFNFWILEARYKPLISMLEDIRLHMMARMRDKRKSMIDTLSKGRRFGHRVYARLEEEIIKSRECYAQWTGDEEYEIGGVRGGTIVNLRHWTCTCRNWQLCGIPCCHAVSAITSRRMDPEDYVYDCLKGETYLMCYGTMMKAMNGESKWPQTDKPALLPPPPRVLKGRPKLMRRKDAIEDGKSNTRSVAVVDVEDPFKKVITSRKGMKMTCKICRKEGHNIRKCPDKPRDEISDPRREKEPVRRKNTSTNEEASSGSRNRVSARQQAVTSSSLQASFMRSSTSFITTESLQRQSVSKKRARK